MNEAVVEFLRLVPIQDVMAHLARLTAYDRYQASAGIGHAAALVAEAAQAIGLADVTIDTFPANGAAHWWTFRAPVAWTPVVARLEIFANDRRVLEVDHARQPFSIATYSAATPAGGVVARLTDVRDGARGLDAAGAIAIVGRSQYGRSDLLFNLAAAGAIGFVTDAPACHSPDDTEHPGRIELAPDTPLFGFSVTSRELRAMRAAEAAGGHARAIVEIERTALMPVVSATLPGESSGGEVWMMSHLCHPRPGANDNASGVAALLGVAAAHVADRNKRMAPRSTKTIRFIWGPEFLGTAAMLHKTLSLLGANGLPGAVINLDMVGEDQSLCGSPFLMERSPDCIPSLINPIAEHLLEQVFVHTRGHEGCWRSTPFAGFSDHALFAAPNIRRPAIQFCHAPDRFNHSAADSLDKVSSTEMLRATTAAAALAQWLVNGNHASVPTDSVVRQWCAREHFAAQRIAHEYRDVKGGEWGREFVHHVATKNAVLLGLLAGDAASVSMDADESSTAPTDDTVLLGRWCGPFNARAMAADLSRETRIQISSMIRADKQNLALLLNFAIRADGRLNRDQIVRETSFALQRPLDPGVANQLLNALLESGWAENLSARTQGAPAR